MSNETQQPPAVPAPPLRTFRSGTGVEVSVYPAAPPPAGFPTSDTLAAAFGRWVQSLPTQTNRLPNRSQR